jgi:hypothetical protein
VASRSFPLLASLPALLVSPRFSLLILCNFFRCWMDGTAHRVRGLPNALRVDLPLLHHQNLPTRLSFPLAFLIRRILSYPLSSF